MKFKRKSVLTFILAILSIILIASFAWHSYVIKKKQDVCRKNQRMYAAVIESCVLDRGLYEGDTIFPFPIDWFPGQVPPKCWSGGKYVVPPVGQYPYCTYHGHLFDETGVWSKWSCWGGKARKRPVEAKK